jgi:membrane protease YdiL (CAAX protease family)
VKVQRQKYLLLFSILLLILTGHYFAAYVSTNKETAWLWVLLFYGGWILLSLFAFLSFSDLKEMFRPSIKAYWNLLPYLCIIPVIFFIFIPNIGLLKPDKWLIANLFICFTGPWLEEIYWRGLITKFWGSNLISFLLSSILFAASHPFIFGVNSAGDSGIPAFAGTLIIGVVWWWCYYKTKSLRGCVFTHFLTDVAGMAVYILTNQARLVPVESLF